jgi:hypothetical protein
MTVATVAGARARKVSLRVPNKGVWVAEVELENDQPLSGRVEVVVGGLRASGTVDPSDTGTFGGVTRARIVAGAGRWGDDVAAKSYQNDLGVKASQVAQEAAAAVGETLGVFVPRAARLGKHFAREAAAAVVALELASGGAAWWVDYTGTTQVGTRAAGAADPRDYEVLAYDPDGRVVTLAVDRPEALAVGQTLAKNLPETLTIAELAITASPEDLTVTAWCGAGEGALQRAMRAVVSQMISGRLPGLYRYRIVSAVGDRVDLQAVRKAAGVPDLLKVSMWPGVAGSHATLAPSAEVLVQFLEGDPSQPVVTAFAGKDGAGFVPLLLELGGAGGPFAARVGDPVQVTLPPAAFSGTIGGSPATGTVTWVPPAVANGTIVGGSTKVRIGS